MSFNYPHLWVSLMNTYCLYQNMKLFYLIDFGTIFSSFFENWEDKKKWWQLLGKCIYVDLTKFQLKHVLTVCGNKLLNIRDGYLQRMTQVSSDNTCKGDTYTCVLNRGHFHSFHEKWICNKTTDLIIPTKRDISCLHCELNN